ncbi:hypothetical protein BDW69DRAFT_162300 [Aspergillus filifer]
MRAIRSSTFPLFSIVSSNTMMQGIPRLIVTTAHLHIPASPDRLFTTPTRDLIPCPVDFPSIFMTPRVASSLVFRPSASSAKWSCGLVALWTLVDVMKIGWQVKYSTLSGCYSLDLPDPVEHEDFPLQAISIFSPSPLSHVSGRSSPRPSVRPISANLIGNGLQLAAHRSFDYTRPRPTRSPVWLLSTTDAFILLYNRRAALTSAGSQGSGLHQD